MKLPYLIIFFFKYLGRYVSSTAPYIRYKSAQSIAGFESGILEVWWRSQRITLQRPSSMNKFHTSVLESSWKKNSFSGNTSRTSGSPNRTRLVGHLARAVSLATQLQTATPSAISEACCDHVTQWRSHVKGR